MVAADCSEASPSSFSPNDHLPTFVVVFRSCQIFCTVGMCYQFCSDILFPLFLLQSGKPVCYVWFILYVPQISFLTLSQSSFCLLLWPWLSLKTHLVVIDSDCSVIDFMALVIKKVFELHNSWGIGEDGDVMLRPLEWAYYG